VLCIAFWLLRIVVLFFLQERSVCVLLTGVHFLHCSEYWVMCINVCVSHVQVIFTVCIFGTFPMCLLSFFMCSSNVHFYLLWFHTCLVFNMWLEYPELLLLFLTVCICTLYLVWNILPACPMYFSGQSRHFVL
jgi:hypothetical protein